MKKTSKIMSIALAMLMTAGLASCGSSDDKGNDGSKAASNSGETVEVKMAVWGSGAADNFNKGADVFNSRQDKIKFSVEMQSGDYNQFLGDKTAANDLPDMFFLSPYAQVAQFAKNGKTLDLSDQPFAERIYDSAKASCEYDGKLYAYPMVQEMLGIFYNKDMFKDAGIETVPTTISEFEDACEKLKAKGYTPLAATYKDSWTENHTFSCLLGAALQDDMNNWIESMNAGTGSFDVENADAMFRFLDIMKENSGDNYMDADSTAGFNALANGEAAMLFSGEFSLLNMASINPDLPVGLFAVPMTDNAADAKLDVDVGICVAVNKDGKHVDQTLEVLDYMSDNTDKEGWIANTADSLGAAPVCMDYEGAFTADYLTDYQKYVSEENTRPWVYQQLAAGTQTIVGDTVQGYFAGSKDQATVLKELDQQYADLIS